MESTLNLAGDSSGFAGRADSRAHGLAPERGRRGGVYVCLNKRGLQSRAVCTRQEALRWCCACLCRGCMPGGAGNGRRAHVLRRSGL